MEGRDEGPVFVTQELVPEHARALLREELHHCDPKLPGTSTMVFVLHNLIYIIAFRSFTSAGRNAALLEQLGRHGASECWHKHGTFKQHLFGVWRILYLWKQSQAVRHLQALTGFLYSLLLLLLSTQVSRCGLYHSAYSNSYVNLAIFKPETGRETVRSAVGHEAEELVRSRPHFPLATFASHITNCECMQIHFFCTIPRQELIFDHILPLHPDKPIPKVSSGAPHLLLSSVLLFVTPRLISVSHRVQEGVEVRHIRNKDEKIRVSPKLMKISLLLTIADFCVRHLSCAQCNARGAFTQYRAAYTYSLSLSLSHTHTHTHTHTTGSMVRMAGPSLCQRRRPHHVWR
jgi:hypothetical protein